MPFRTKRVYDPAEASDGERILVDRLWPRGVSKERAELDAWEKDAAPSPALRTEWHHAEDRPGTFDAFAARYRDELDENPAAAALLERGRAADASGETITLLFGARDETRNHATVLLGWLVAHGATAR
ncbi:DUF488 domain-containing protein [Agromyces sp. MMS24-JH15]|uniref:DUF488 domain-containing protein n=1 Tax=Agromyces sp. MMS24-JH15 TaxID=3243765 RepID=UPI003749B191